LYVQKGSIMKVDSKSKRLNLRLAEEEIQFIESQANMCKMSVSEYIRRCSVNTEKIVIVDPEGLIATLLGNVYQALSNNNALTKDDKKTISSELMKVVDTLYKTIMELK